MVRNQLGTFVFSTDYYVSTIKTCCNDSKSDKIIYSKNKKLGKINEYNIYLYTTLTEEEEAIQWYDIH